MGLSSSKTKTSSTSNSSSTPLDQYAPYINQGLSTAQGVLDSNQGNMQSLSSAATNIANGFATPNAALSNVYTGQSPAQATYTKLQQAGANDPSMGVLSGLAQGSTSPGNYNGIGTGNPALGDLQGMTSGQVNGDSSQFYKDTLSGKYLNNNPYLDAIAKQGTDAATLAANQRFAASGMGEGMSTPYAGALGTAITNANDQFRYGAYNDELNRMGTIGAQSDSEYNSTQDRNLSAANDLGNQYNTGQGLQLSANQAKDAAFNSDRNSQLAAAQSLGSQNAADNNTALSGANGDINSILSALGLVPGMTAAQTGALGTAAQIPYAGVNSYANLINGLTGKYGNTSGSSTSTQTQSGNIGQMLTGLAGGALGAFAGGGLGSLGSLGGGGYLSNLTGGINSTLSGGLSPLNLNPNTNIMGI